LRQSLGLRLGGEFLRCTHESLELLGYGGSDVSVLTVCVGDELVVDSVEMVDVEVAVAWAGAVTVGTTVCVCVVV
jgi:hypothetical protein